MKLTFVLTKDEVLEIERALGGMVHLRSSEKPVDARRKQAKCAEVPP
jgi:hypothetical protein